jgi:cytochrome P450
VKLVKQADQVQKPAVLKGIFRSSFGNGLFFSEGEFWKCQRKLAQPAFQAQRIQAYAQGMVARAQDMLTRWQPGQVVDIDKELSAVTLEIVVNTLFHTTVVGETDEIEANLTELGQIITCQIVNPALALLPDWFPWPLMWRKRRVSAALDAIIYRIIRQRREAGEDKGDLLSMFMLAQDEAGQQMTDRQLHDEVLTIFIAGHETTALALAWVLVLLAQHQYVAAKLQAEVDSVLDNRPPTLADLPNLVYTDMVIKDW